MVLGEQDRLVAAGNLGGAFDDGQKPRLDLAGEVEVEQVAPHRGGGGRAVAHRLGRDVAERLAFLEGQLERASNFYATKEEVLREQVRIEKAFAVLENRLESHSAALEDLRNRMGRR